MCVFVVIVGHLQICSVKEGCVPSLSGNKGKTRN